MKILKYIMIVASIILLIIIIIGFILPDNYNIESTVSIKSSRKAVIDNIIDLRQWEKWSYFSNKLDTTMLFEYKANNFGEYSHATWTSKYIGDGAIKIYEYKPEHTIRYEIYLNENSHKINGSFILDSNSNGVILKWIDYGNLGLNPISRIFGKFMEIYAKQDQETSLVKLKKLVENK